MPENEKTAQSREADKTDPSEPEKDKPQSAEPKRSLLNAETVTRMAINFVESLGNKYVTPKRVLRENERTYGVQLYLRGGVASVLIDRDTEKITEYEISEVKEELPEGGGAPSSSLRNLVIIFAIQILLTAAINVLKLYVDIPFLTGPPPK